MGGKFMFLDENAITVKGGGGSLLNIQYSEIHAIYTKSNTIQSEVEVIKMDGTKFKGILNEVKDSKLTMHDIQFGYMEVYPQEIEKIRIRSLKQQRIAMAVGGLAGLAVGIAIGANQGEPSDCQGFSCIGSAVGDAQDNTATALLLGVGLGVAGGAVGALVGSAKIVISINGRVDQFKANQARMNKYVIPREYYE